MAGSDIGEQMDREFSKDISAYKKKAWKGFSMAELIIGLAAIAGGGGITFLLVEYVHIPFMFTVYITGFISVPIIYIFIKRDRGYTIPEIMIRKRELRKTSGKLPYVSHEMLILLEMKKGGNQKHVVKKKRTG